MHKGKSIIDCDLSHLIPCLKDIYWKNKAFVQYIYQRTIKNLIICRMSEAVPCMFSVKCCSIKSRKFHRKTLKVKGLSKKNTLSQRFSGECFETFHNNIYRTSLEDCFWKIVISATLPSEILK